MYRVDFSGISEAISRIYDFMTIPTLNMPECTVWGHGGPVLSLTNNCGAFMTRTQFQKRLLGCNMVAISCVASTDKADTRRAVLTYTKELDFMVLNFPSAVSGLNADEKKVIEYLDRKQLS